MEIKTCEQYVLSQLDTLTRVHEQLTGRFIVLSKSVNEIFRLINPHFNGDKVEFYSVDGDKYLELLNKINGAIKNTLDTNHEETPPIEKEPIEE